MVVTEFSTILRRISVPGVRLAIGRVDAREQPTDTVSHVRQLNLGGCGGARTDGEVVERLGQTIGWAKRVHGVQPSGMQTKPPWKSPSFS